MRISDWSSDVALPISGRSKFVQYALRACDGWTRPAPGATLPASASRGGFKGAAGGGTDRQGSAGGRRRQGRAGAGGGPGEGGARADGRSAERRGGKERGLTCRPPGAHQHSNKKNNTPRVDSKLKDI